MAGFRDRGARRHSRHYVEHSDRAKARQGVFLGRRSSELVQHAGYSRGRVLSTKKYRFLRWSYQSLMTGIAIGCVGLLVEFWVLG